MAPLVSVARLRAFFVSERGTLRAAPYAVVAAAGVALGAAAGLAEPGARLDWSLYDLYSRAALTNEPAPGLVVVAIDEPSFAEIGLQWPWPRSLHAALVDRLAEGGARTIALDILFDVPATREEDDAALADAVRRAGNVVLATDQAVIEDRGYALTQWTDPIPALAKSAAGLGADRIPYDADGVLRRAWLRVDGRPSLALAIASRDPGFTPPDTSDTPRLVRFNGEPRRGVLTVSYYQALDATASLPPDIFKDKHVLVGRALAAAPIDEQTDHFTTPVAPRMAGVEIHATIVDALRRGRFVADPLAHWSVVLLISAGLAAALAAAVFRLAPAWALLAAGATLGVLGSVGYVALARGVRVPIVAPSLAVIGAYAATAVYRFALVSRERRLIKRAFQHYVAPAIVERMLEDPSQLKLGGTEYEVTVLFSDLEGFTTLSEHLGAADLSAHLSMYFKAMLDVLLPERGTLDKLIGDAIMMYFGCPIRDDRHAVQACRGALAMQRQMALLNTQWAGRSLPPLRTRIGINTGPAIAGNMGTDAIFNYTILGDAVNLASRLEGVNKEYGTLVIIGEQTWQRVHSSFVTRELDWIRVKGKTEPVAIYELVAEAGAVSETDGDVFRRYAEGLASYRAGQFQDAAARFAEALTLDPDDGPSRTLRARCADLAHRPPALWDGVHVMQTK